MSKNGMIGAIVCALSGMETKYIGIIEDAVNRINSKDAEAWRSQFIRIFQQGLPQVEVLAPIKKTPLFDHVGQLDFPGLPSFNTDTFFTTDTPEGAEVKLTYIGKNFINWFGGMEVVETGALKLSLDRLREYSYDPEIIEEIGDENCDHSLAVIRWHIESGQAKKNSWYVGYFVDKCGVRRAVRWFWDGGGWSVNAVVVPRSSWWSVGREFVSRKPLVTLPKAL